MIYSNHKNFIQHNDLAELHQDLVTNSKWVWRNQFWRYYLIDHLRNYNEADESTWYGNQSDALNSGLSGPWKKLFNQVFELAGPNFVLQRYALTGQTQGQDGNFHLDTSTELVGDFRSYLMYLNTSWDNAWGGITEFKHNDKIVHVEYPEPGKLVEFDSQAMHRGLGPEIPNFLRLTIVLHGKIV